MASSGSAPWMCSRRFTSKDPGKRGHIQCHHQRLREGQAGAVRPELLEGIRSLDQANVIAYNSTISPCGKGQAVAARLGVVGGDSPVRAPRRRDNVQRHHQRLQERAAVTARLGTAAGDSPAEASGRCDHVQLHHQPCGKGEQWQSPLEVLEERHPLGLQRKTRSRTTPPPALMARASSGSALWSS